jgi:PAS domain S-box-containing protein
LQSFLAFRTGFSSRRIDVTDERKTKKQLMDELEEMRRRLAAFEEQSSRHRELEEALKESEERFRKVFDNAPYSIMLSRIRDGAVVAVNPAFERKSGYSASEVMGKNVLELEIIANRGDYQRLYDMLLQKGHIDNIPLETRNRNGESRHILFSTTNVELQGEPSYVTMTVDVTDEIRAVEALRFSEQKFFDIFNLSPDYMGISRVSDGRLMDVNRSFEEGMEWSRQEAIGRTALDLELWENPQHRAEAVEKMKQAGRLDNFDFVYRTKSGSKRYGAISMTPIRIQSDDCLCFAVRDVHDRKLTEEALKASEGKFRALADSSSAGIFLIQGPKFIYVNHAFAETTGYKTDDLLMMNFWDVVHPDFQNLVKERAWGRLRGENPPSRYEIKFLTGDGQIRWIDFSASVIELDNKQTIIGSAWDITERKTAEQALRDKHEELNAAYEKLAAYGKELKDQYKELSESKQALQEREARYKLITDNMTDRIWLMDINLKMTWNSPSVARSRGFSLDDLRTLPLERHLTPASLETAMNTFAEALSPDNLRQKDLTISRQMELELTKKDGSTFWSDIQVTLLRDPEGNPVGFLGVGRDITKRKQAEELYRILADSSYAGVFIVQDGKFQFVNPHILEYSGYSASELIGNDSYNFVHPDDHAQLRTNAIDMLKGRITNPYEYRIIDSKGKIRRLIETVKLITYRGKRAVLGNTMDVTERYRMESLLRQSQKMEAIGTLAGGIAHDFNNILGAIMGYTDMALMTAEADGRLRRYLEQVYKAGERARDLVNQILAFSRQSDEKPRPLRISPIVKETLKLLRASLPATIQIHQNIESGSDVVLADPTQIHQIMMNLCTNAAHAMKDRKGDLKVALVPVEINLHDDLVEHHGLSPGMFLKLTISDTGIGIAPEIIDRIFDPFFTTKKPGEGTGMGLSVVYGIVKGYGGVITVDSKKGKGSQFHVYLPLLIKEGIENEKEDSTPIVGGKERILFVDDEENLVQLGTDMLTSLGYEVTGRTSSMEALELFRTKPNRFDLMITDMTMPNMTGFDLAKESILIRPNIPIILCTGFSEIISEEKAKSIGIRRFILKPLLKKSLAATIREILDEK